MKKSTLLAGLVFVGLLAAAVMTMQQKPERGITRISFKTVDSTKIDKIEIKGTNAIELKKEGEDWRLGNGKEADSNAVKRLLDAIPTINSSKLVTRDSARYADLEVDEEKGTPVTIYTGSTVAAEFTVGKAGGGGGHFRVKDEVYLVPKVYPTIFSKQASAWHQLKLFKDDLADVSKAQVTLAGETPYTLVKADDNWSLEDTAVVPEGFRFDKNQARTLVSNLVNARARQIMDSDPGVEKTGLDKADKVAFEGKDGKLHELLLGGPAEKEKEIYVQVVGKPDVYTLADYTVKNLRKKPTELRELTMMTLDKDKVQKLEIKANKKNLVFEKQGAEWKIAKSSDKIPGDFELDTAAVDRRVSSLATARATKLAPADVTLAKAGLTRPAATVTAVLDDKSKVTLAFGAAYKDEERDAFYALGNADQAIYSVTKWSMENLTGGLDKFKKRPQPAAPPNIDPSAMSNLPPDVRASLMKQLQQKQQQEQMMKQIQAQMAAQEASKDKKAN